MLSHRRSVLTEGYFGWSGRSGMMLSDGCFWTRRGGGCNFYVGQNGVSGVDFANPVAACGPQRGLLDIGGFSEAEYWLAVTAVSSFGLESADYAYLRIRPDDAVPAAVDNLRWDVIANGKVKLYWDYTMGSVWVEPEKFEIFYANAEDDFDYDNPDAEVTFRATRREYWWNGASTAGTELEKFAVRAVTAGGVHDGSLRYVIARPDYALPGNSGSFTAEQL